MTDSPDPVQSAVTSTGDNMDGPKLVYILYFIGFVVGITALAGLIVAYLKRGEAGPNATTHFTFQIRTFWIGLLFSFIGAITSMIVIGVIILFATVVWALIRLIKGFMLASDDKPIPDPETWLW
ncbi:hypothetical protein [Parvibaculum sp.]|jgi:uncharacterized membrane protein|uniref:DUF4870 family protein n=1 Tax=Parvibaculum sp. TaxID=2024848 RepID=UPI000C89CF14|nr:hypothetical protein [Parvibaculum sp.]MAB15227.1 hypothetical protein [Parvibaculum sp.]